MRFRKKLIIAVAAIVTITSAAVVHASVSKSNIKSKEPVKSSLAYAAPKLNDNPPIVFKANKDESSSLLVSKDAVEAKIKQISPQVKDGTGTIKSIELKTWGEYVGRDRNDPGFKCGYISDDHMVWVTKVSCSDKVFAMNGFYSNAQLIYVIDSETGEDIADDVSGKFEPINSSNEKDIPAGANIPPAMGLKPQK